MSLSRKQIDRATWLAFGPVAVGLVAVLASEVPGLWPFAPRAAVQAAQQQYEQRSGLRGLDVAGATAWGDCAIVDLEGAPGRGQVSVVVRERQGDWVLVRAEDPATPIDADDVDGHDACVRLGESRGELD